MTSESACDIDCVVFDLGGVLIRWNPQEFVDEIFEHLPALQRPHAIVEFCKANDGIWAALDRGDLQLQQQAIEKVAANETEFGFSGVDLQLFFDGLQTKCLTPIPEGVKVLEAVRAAGHRTFVLSNYQHQLYEFVSSSNAFFKGFEGAIVSAFVGKNKPHPDIYHSLLSQYSLKPEQCLFIDDTLANVEGAKAVGIEALHCTDHDQLAQDLVRLGICPPI